MRVIVVGGGRIGSHLAQELASRGHDVTVIEKRAARCQELSSLLGPAKVHIVCGDGNDPALLREVGARDADALAAATGEDEDNLVAALLAKREFGIRRVIGRVNNPRNEWLYSAAMGIDGAVQPASLIVSLLEEKLETG